MATAGHALYASRLGGRRQSSRNRERTMITGAHFLLYSTDADADREFLRLHFGFTSVDAGDGWLIFGLPPAELAVHPAEAELVGRLGADGLSGTHLYLMCDDVQQETRRLASDGVACSALEQASWGTATTIVLPSGARIGLYQPTHRSPLFPEADRV